MLTRIIRVNSDTVQKSWSDHALKSIAQLPVVEKAKSLGFSLKAPAWIKSAGMAISTAAESVSRSVAPKLGAIQVEDVKIKLVKDMIDSDGQRLAIGVVYAKHPIRDDIYIRSDQLHTYIVNEQRSHVIRYFRSAVALRNISIEIVSQKSGNYFAAGGWKVGGSGSRELSEEQRRWFSASFDNPAREENIDVAQLYWMPYFDEIVAATSGVHGGRVETVTTLDMSFGVSADAAKVASINANWLSHQSFVIRAEYA